MKKFFLPLFAILSLLVITSCSSVPREKFVAEDATLTFSEQIAPDTVYFRYENAEYPVIFHVVKISLNNSINVTALPKFIVEDFSVEAEKTVDFANRQGAFVAINATPFANKKDLTVPVGIWYENGVLYSEANSRYSGVSFYSDSVKNYVCQTDIVLEDSLLALGGFFTIIKDGKKYGDYIDNKDSRTALGISKDGKTLFILCVEGEKKRKSVGLSYGECADILLLQGAWNALELDGGASTSLVINGKNVLSYEQKRKVALNLGFKRFFANNFFVNK